MRSDSEHRQVSLRRSGPDDVLFTMRDPQRPWNDDFVDFMVDISGAGLQASAPVTSLQGDGLAEFFAGLAGAFRGWEGMKSWRSLEDQMRIGATWHNRGHVTLSFMLRPTVYDTAWEVQATFDVEAGAEMDALSNRTAEFFQPG